MSHRTSHPPQSAPPHPILPLHHDHYVLPPELLFSWLWSASRPCRCCHMVRPWGMVKYHQVKKELAREFYSEGTAWTDIPKEENKRYWKPPNSSKYFKRGLWPLESGPIKRTLTADILDIQNSSKRVLCIRITDDLRFVEIVQINIYVQP